MAQNNDDDSPQDFSVLKKWLEGDADEDDLRGWLKNMYPSSVHSSIDEAFGPDEHRDKREGPKNGK